MTSNMIARIRNYALMALTLTTLTSIALPAVGQNKNPGAPAPSSQNVLVTNTAAQPVPTAAQGTTTVAGTVNIGNTPSVNVANSVSVNLASTATVATPQDGQGNPIPLAVSEAYHPFEDTCTMSFGGNGSGYCQFQTPPPGTRIVVQQFDAASGFLPNGLESGCKPLVVALKVAHSGNSHFFPATFMGTQAATNRDFYATHQDTRLYGDVEEVPQCTVNLSCYSQATYTCHISGYTVP